MLFKGVLQGGPFKAEQSKVVVDLLMKVRSRNRKGLAGAQRLTNLSPAFTRGVLTLLPLAFLLGWGN